MMESPISGRSVIDIRATANKHRNITEYLPGVHALSGCDTTSYLYGIGKLTALKVLSSGRSFELLGREGTNMADVEAEATSFMVMVLCICQIYQRCQISVMLSGQPRWGAEIYLKLQS